MRKFNLRKKPIIPSTQESVNATVLKSQVDTTSEATVSDLAKAFKPKKAWIVLLSVGIGLILVGVGSFLFALLRPHDLGKTFDFPVIPSAIATETTYSVLTGEAIADANMNSSPTYCVQVPNGTDGARPQAGIDEAGVVFEAIAERGITRFAAIFQNPKSAVIGPIRSLRLYYLEWDIPFNCTIVHAGGADDALAAVRAGGYRDLTESHSYMYRGGRRSRPNNLFTTPTQLKRFNTDRSFNSSQVTGFTRMKPVEAEKARFDSLASEKLEITTATKQDTSKFTPVVPKITLKFTNAPNYSVVYNYNMDTNTYARSYASGVNHNVYHCPAGDLGEKDPEAVCQLVQLNPSVVIAMIVKESLAADRYHENIVATGSFPAYIFQNGLVIKGSWRKNTRNDQIKFYDEAGVEIALVPGQTFISAIPEYGKVEY